MSESTDELRRTALYATGRFAAWRRRKAARRLVSPQTPERARCLAELFLHSRDEAVVHIAQTALSKLLLAECLDAVGELAMETGDGRLQELIDESGHLPSDPERRTLWLLLVGRFEEAEELDFDGGLLRSAYSRADHALRLRIAARVRESSRTPWLVALTSALGRRDAVRPADWEAAVDQLTAARRWDELWGLATKAPLPWAARILSILGEHRWKPEREVDGHEYDRLIALAASCTTPLSAASLFGSVETIFEDAPTSSGQFHMAREGHFIGLARFRDPNVRIWDLRTGDWAGRLAVHDAQPSTLVIAPDGSHVAVCGYEFGVRVMSLPGGGVSTALSTPRFRPEHLAFASGGELLAGVGVRSAWLWHVPTEAMRWSTRTPGIPYPKGATVTPDDQMLIVWGSVGRVNNLHGRVRLQHLASGEPLGGIELEARQHPLQVKVTPDSKRLVIVCAASVHLWDLPSLTPIAGWDIGSRAGVAMTTDSTRLIGIREDGDIEVRRASDGVVVVRIERDARLSSHCRLAVSGNGRLLMACDFAQGPIRLWHVPGGEPAGVFSDSSGDVLDFAPDGTAIAFSDAANARSGYDRLVIRRPEAALTGDTPVAEVTVQEVERLRRRGGPPEDRPWLDLLDALVRWRHRHDVDVSDAVAGLSGDTDIELDRT
jgi:WD40 repeat protein